MQDRSLRCLIVMSFALLNAAVGYGQVSTISDVAAIPEREGATPGQRAASPFDSDDAEAQLLPRRGRFLVRQASIAAGYSSVGLGNGSSSNAAIASLTADYFTISSVETTYSSRNQRSGTNLTYTPVYIQRYRFNELSSLNHLISFSTRRQVASRNWLTFSVSGSAASAEQVVFGSSQAGRLAGSGASADALSQAILGQHQTDSDMAHLTATSGTDPLSFAIYGGRVLSANASAEHQYILSRRTTMQSRVNVFRSQGLRQATSVADGLNLRSSAVTGSWGLNYSISPRTTTGATVSYTRINSTGINNQSTSIEYSIGRLLSRRWMTSVSTGVGRVSLLPSGTLVQARPASLIFSGSASVGFRGRLHSLVGSFRQHAGDSYGIGAGSTRIAQVALNSALPGRSWSTMVGGSYQSLGSFSGQLRTWQVQSGYARRINTHMSVTTSVAYMSVINAQMPSIQPALSGFHARVSLLWSPTAGAAR